MLMSIHLAVPISPCSSIPTPKLSSPHPSSFQLLPTAPTRCSLGTRTSSSLSPSCNQLGKLLLIFRTFVPFRERFFNRTFLRSGPVLPPEFLLFGALGEKKLLPGRAKKTLHAVSGAQISPIDVSADLHFISTYPNSLCSEGLESSLTPIN